MKNIKLLGIIFTLIFTSCSTSESSRNDQYSFVCWKELTDNALQEQQNRLGEMLLDVILEHNYSKDVLLYKVSSLTRNVSFVSKKKTYMLSEETCSYVEDTVKELKGTQLDEFLYAINTFFSYHFGTSPKLVSSLDRQQTKRLLDLIHLMQYYPDVVTPSDTLWLSRFH